MTRTALLRGTVLIAESSPGALRLPPGYVALPPFPRKQFSAFPLNQCGQVGEPARGHVDEPARISRRHGRAPHRYQRVPAEGPCENQHKLLRTVTYFANRRHVAIVAFVAFAASITQKLSKGDATVRGVRRMDSRAQSMVEVVHAPEGGNACFWAPPGGQESTTSRPGQGDRQRTSAHQEDVS